MSKNFFRAAMLAAVLTLGGAGCVNFGGSSSALGPAGVFRSIDKGERWTPLTAYPTPQGVKSIAGVNIYQFYTDPGDPNAIYLGTRGQGLFYTFNRGESWQRAEALSGKFIYALAVDPHDKCTVYVSDGPHIYKTTDCLRTWKLVYSEERPSQRLVGLAVDYGNSRAVYGAILGGDIIVSNDGGENWRAARRFDFEVRQIVADPFAARRVYVASYRNGLFRSDDGGVNWVDLSAGLNNFNEATTFYRIVLHPKRQGSLFWISKYGILRSDDAGTTWADLKLLTPPGSVNIYAFGVNPANDKELYYVATILGEKNTPLRSTFYQSVDGGKTWETKKLPTNTIPIALYIHPAETNVLILGFTVSE